MKLNLLGVVLLTATSSGTARLLTPRIRPADPLLGLTQLAEPERPVLHADEGVVIAPTPTPTPMPVTSRAVPASHP